MAEAVEEEKRQGEETVKLFVGQVPKHMTESQLLELFRESASVVEVNIIKDKVTRAPRGCCFVICTSREEADKAVNAYHNKKTLPGASSPLQVKYADGELERLEHKLFVGMLPKDVSEGEVLSLFSNYGTVKDLRVLRGSQHTTKGCAFLKYESKEQAVAALESINGKHKMEGSNIPLVVKWADTEKERQARRLQMPYSHGFGPTNANLQNPSLFGALGMSYFPPYNGYGYHAPGGYGYMQYRPPHMQNMVSPPMQSKTTRGVSSESVAPRNFPMSYVGSGYPSVPGHQYPMPYPRGMMSPQPMNGSYGSVSPATSAGFSTSPGPQTEGPPGANLFIYNIPQEFGDQELANAFQPFGIVLSAKVFMDKATGVSKCFGFVSFDSPAAAQSATGVMNGRQLGGKKLKVQPKRENKQGRPEMR